MTIWGVAPTQLDPEGPTFPTDPGSAVQDHQYVLVDLGGCGDCAFRATADSNWWNSSPPENESFSVERAQKEGAWLRAQTVTHLRKHKEKFLPFLTTFTVVNRLMIGWNKPLMRLIILTA